MHLRVLSLEENSPPPVPLFTEILLPRLLIIIIILYKYEVC